MYDIFYVCFTYYYATGVPATVLHASSSGSKRNDQLTVAQTVADIITAKDCLALGQTAVDEIQV